MPPSDLIIVGGGIVGLATAFRFLERFPGKCIAVLEKEAVVAKHQTGRNSGVLHSGIYYRPGSLKAENCRAGKLAMEQFCREQGIRFELCGKIIVAVDDDELVRMEMLLERGRANGVTCELIGPERIRELAPHAVGRAAIYVPEAGIIDYAEVARRLAQLIGEQGGKIVTGARVTAIHREPDQVIVETTAGEFAAKQVVNCAGLYSDRMTRLSGAEPSGMIVPFRGEFYLLKPEARDLVPLLIYPVPDPNYPFLGVHFTLRLDGRVECGPNAVLAFAREGYTNSTVNLRDLAETLGYGGFWRLAGRYWRIGADEMWRSLSKGAFVRALQRLVPAVETKDLDWAPAGVRAQSVSPAGQMVDDFVIQETDRVINVENAPSPAATASLNIGRLVVERLVPRFE